ncbi:hypothetical protein EVG20_g1998 [Dentipellis fragilis]|uniref:Uncharacterized protein n=1 Tax=Dentipellis fragilis TaxID=205917 RepID=A0A4Y9ZC88_9AGAM|nr:hypothetical protein EVG20_g1998 [Dentipellis fragilis]
MYCLVPGQLDGYLARTYKMTSVLGTILDPTADKMLMTTLAVTLTMKGLLPLPLTAIILGRDVLLSLSAFWIRYTSLPQPYPFNLAHDISENIPAVLGLLHTLRRSEAHHNQQGKYGPAALADGRDNRGPAAAHPGWHRQHAHSITTDSCDDDDLVWPLLRLLQERRARPLRHPQAAGSPYPTFIAQNRVLA